MKEIFELEAGLERLAGNGEVHADDSVTGKVQQLGRALARQLPEHCSREEERLLSTVAEVSPELAAFVREMKQQHTEMRAQLNALCKALDALDQPHHSNSALAHLMDQGHELARFLRQHIAMEEHELSGFL